MSWSQFQSGLAAVFIASALFTVVALLIVVSAPDASNNNTNIINTPYDEMRSRPANERRSDATEQH